jgi:hypothetical protein
MTVDWADASAVAVGEGPILAWTAPEFGEALPPQPHPLRLFAVPSEDRLYAVPRDEDEP